MRLTHFIFATSAFAGFVQAYQLSDGYCQCTGDCSYWVGYGDTCYVDSDCSASHWGASGYWDYCTPAGGSTSIGDVISGVVDTVGGMVDSGSDAVGAVVSAGQCTATVATGSVSLISNCFPSIGITQLGSVFEVSDFPSLLKLLGSLTDNFCGSKCDEVLNSYVTDVTSACGGAETVKTSGFADGLFKFKELSCLSDGKVLCMVNEAIAIEKVALKNPSFTASELASYNNSMICAGSCPQRQAKAFNNATKTIGNVLGADMSFISKPLSDMATECEKLVGGSGKSTGYRTYSYSAILSLITLVAMMIM